jgi:hypothetical protein
VLQSLLITIEPYLERLVVLRAAISDLENLTPDPRVPGAGARALSYFWLIYGNSEITRREILHQLQSTIARPWPVVVRRKMTGWMCSKYPPAQKIGRTPCQIALDLVDNRRECLGSSYSLDALRTVALKTKPSRRNQT